MALNTWWRLDPAQRYWMEITHRDDVGTDLNAPKLPQGQWTYDLVSQVQHGDRIRPATRTARVFPLPDEVTAVRPTTPHSFAFEPFLGIETT
jgi:hypothetical protein